MKKVLFVSCFPDAIYNEMIQSNIIYTQAAQKFNKLLVKGLCLNEMDVDVLCVVKEEYFVYPKAYSEQYAEREIKYTFCNVKGDFLTRTKIKKQYVKEQIKKWATENPKGIVILDSLSPVALEVAKQTKKNGLKLIIHVTDFKDLLFKNKGSLRTRIYRKILNAQFYKQFKYANAFILLTEAMKQKIAIKNRPCLIMDGVCDYELWKKTIVEYKSDKKIFLYTGSLNKIYGLQNLVEGFLNAQLSHAELHLYGWGDYVEELKEIIKSCSNIKYFSTVPNDQIVLKQQQATYCVNPRPVGDEYTKYSFPSKTIEYMVSGRPIITTKLPCITKEYEPYVFWFENDSVEGISKTLQKCYEIDEVALKRKGEQAREYILSSKNNKKQIFDLFQII